MATIVDYPALGQPTYAGPRLQLHGEDFVRPFSFGNNWSRIQIGIRFTLGTFVDRATSLPQAPNTYALGVCQGIARPWNSYHTDFAVGAGPGYYNGNSWSSPGVGTFWGAGSDGSGFKYSWWGYKVGTLVYQGINYLGPSNNHIAAVPTFTAGQLTHPTHHYISIKRGAANSGKLDIAWASQTQGQNTLITRKMFWYNMDKEAGTTLGTTQGAYSNNTAAVWYINGVLDCGMVHWDRIVPCMELLDFNVVRFA